MVIAGWSFALPSFMETTKDFLVVKRAIFRVGLRGGYVVLYTYILPPALPHTLGGESEHLCPWLHHLWSIPASALKEGGVAGVFSDRSVNALARVLCVIVCRPLSLVRARYLFAMDAHGPDCHKRFTSASSHG